MSSHTVLKEQLTEMGFEESLIAKALKQLGDKATIESMLLAIEELMSRGPDEPNVSDDNNGNGVKTDVTTAAEQKQSTDQTESSDPTVATTDAVVVDEKELERKRLAYEEKIKQRRVEREAKEKEEELKREIKRREDGKGMNKLKEELDQLQRKRIADDMRREKAEAKAAKDAILEQIARDREEQRQTRLPATDSKPSPATTGSPLSTLVSTGGTATKDGKCRLAIRLLDGKQLVNEFDSRETLSAVRLYVITQVGVDSVVDTFSFVMPPLPPFTEDDMQKPLTALGLCPSARIHVIRR